MATPYGSYSCATCEMTDQGYVTLATQDVTFEFPDYDENEVAIQGLEAVLKKTQAEAEVKCNQIKQRIAELKCIGYQP